MSNDELLDRYQALPDDARRLFDEFVTVLCRAYGKMPDASPSEPKNADSEPWDPAADPCFGMWADRGETAAADAARQLRGRAKRESA